MLLDLLGDEELAGDHHLFIAGVAGDFQDLQSVPQRRRDRVQDVGGGDKHDLGQVERHFQIVIAEGVVLLGVQHLEQRRAWIAPEVMPELVDLVEHEHRIVGARALHALNDATRQRADVGPTVASNLSLVAHAAQRDTHKLAPHRLGDRLAQRGLTDARRPHQTQDRPLLIGLQLAHREVFQDALFDLLKVVVVGV